MGREDQTITVQLGDMSVELRKPKSHAIRYEILAAADESNNRAGTAALGVCWQAGPTGRKPTARYVKCKCNPLIYGGRVLDELVGRGIDYAELMNASLEAFRLLASDLLDAAEVEEAEDFSEAVPAPSTS